MFGRTSSVYFFLSSFADCLRNSHCCSSKQKTKIKSYYFNKNKERIEIVIESTFFSTSTTLSAKTLKLYKRNQIRFTHLSRTIAINDHLKSRRKSLQPLAFHHSSVNIIMKYETLF